MEIKSVAEATQCGGVWVTAVQTDDGCIWELVFKRDNRGNTTVESFEGVGKLDWLNFTAIDALTRAAEKAYKLHDDTIPDDDPDGHWDAVYEAQRDKEVLA